MARLTSSQGFTLVEVLVILVILAALTSTISLTLPNDTLGERQAAVERWHRQARWAADQSLWTGRAHAWEVEMASARVTERGDQGWVTLEDVQSRALTLPPGLKMAALEIEGQPVRSGHPIVFRRGDVPLFRMRLESEEGRWEIKGDPGGRILWERLGMPNSS